MRSAGEIENDARQLAAVDVTLLPDARVRAEILTLIQTVNICYAALWRRVASFDRRDLATVDCHRSTRSWLRAFGHLSVYAASTTVAKAELLEQLPLVAAAAQDGRLSSDHLTRLMSLADEVGVEPIHQVEDILVGVAERFGPEYLGQACDRVRAHANPDGPEPDPDAMMARRGLTLSRSGDMVRLRGRLDPEAGAIVMAALDALMLPPGPDDTRTAAQRRADALTELCRLPLNYDLLPQTGGNRPQIGLLISPEALLRQAQENGATVADWITHLARFAAAHDSGAASEDDPDHGPGPDDEPDHDSVNGSEDSPRDDGDAGPDNDSGAGSGSGSVSGSGPSSDNGPGDVSDNDSHTANGSPNSAGSGWSDTDGRATPGNGTGTPAHQSQGSDRPPPGWGSGTDPLTAAGIPRLDRGWLTWVGDIPTATAQRLCCDSILYRVLFDPATGQPLDVGRSYRTAPHWIRQALHARDRGCRWPGCSAPIPWTDAHHLNWWTRDNGQTSAQEMIMLCRYHHVRVHEGHWTIQMHPHTGEVRVFRPSGQPYELDPTPSWLHRPG